MMWWVMMTTNTTIRPKQQTKPSNQHNNESRYKTNRKSWKVVVPAWGYFYFCISVCAILWFRIKRWNQIFLLANDCIVLPHDDNSAQARCQNLWHPHWSILLRSCSDHRDHIRLLWSCHLLSPTDLYAPNKRSNWNVSDERWAKHSSICIRSLGILFALNIYHTCCILDNWKRTEAATIYALVSWIQWYDLHCCTSPSYDVSK